MEPREQEGSSACERHTASGDTNRERTRHHQGDDRAKGRHDEQPDDEDLLPGHGTATTMAMTMAPISMPVAYSCTLPFWLSFTTPPVHRAVRPAALTVPSTTSRSKAST